MPRPKRSVISHAKWERFEPLIRRLYLQDDKALPEVLEELRAHDFNPSEAQLESRLKLWHMSKKMSAKQWRYVETRAHQRRSCGKQSSIYLCGIQKDLQNATRNKHLHVTTLQKYNQMYQQAPNDEPESPKDLSLIIRTPPHSSTDDEDIEVTQSQRFFENLSCSIPLNILNDRKASIRAHSQNILDLIFGEFYNLSKNHKDRLNGTYEALRLWMRERGHRSYVLMAEALSRQCDSLSSTTETMELLFFLLANNFHSRWDAEKQKTIMTLLLDTIQRCNGWNLIARQQYSQLSPSLQSTLNCLWKEVVEASDFDAMRSLYAAGVDINVALPDLLRKYASAPHMPETSTAWQYATIINDTRLVEFLVERQALVTKVDLEMVRLASCLRTDLEPKVSPKESVKILLSRYEFVRKDEEGARKLLKTVSSDEIGKVSGTVIDFFRSKITDPQSISQLLITAIKTKSSLTWDLVTEYSNYANFTNGLLETPLTVAACGNDLALCQRLVKLGACLEPSISFSIFTAATPLQCAAVFSDAAMIQCLLDLGANINFCHPLTRLPYVRFVEDTSSEQFYKRKHGNWKIFPGRTALQAALFAHKRENMHLLLSEGATQVGGEPAIACRTGQHSCARDLLHTVPRFRNYAAFSVNDSIIQAAVLNRDFRLVSHMFNCRQRVIPGQSACAAVLVAKRTSDLAAARDLLATIVKPPPEDDFWLGTAMSLAAKLGMPQIADMMMEFGLRPETSAPMANWRSREAFPKMNSATFNIDSVFFEWIEEFWEAGTMTFNVIDPDSPVPIIHAASEIGSCDYLDILVRHNFKVTSVCASIAIAAATDVCDFLRRLSDLGVAMTSGMLAIAINNKSFDVVEWLVSQDIDFEEDPYGDDEEDTPLLSDYTDRLPLEEAVRGGHREIMERLLYLRVKVNNRPYCVGGVTALQAAAIEGYSGILRRLLELNADPNAPGAESWGRTALEGAAEHGRLDAIQILLSSGVKTLDSGRRQYVRAIAYARHHGHHAVVQLLKSHRPWEEADQRILDERNLLDEDQSPRKIAERQRVHCESDEGVESSDEEVGFDSDTESCEDDYRILEEPMNLTGGLGDDDSVSYDQRILPSEQFGHDIVEQQAPTGDAPADFEADQFHRSLPDQAMQELDSNEILGGEFQGLIVDTDPAYEGNRLDIFTSLMSDQTMQDFGYGGSLDLELSNEDLEETLGWTGLENGESWSSLFPGL
ncbi:hypothetical protein CcaCcLH18_04673 [Colletotrichum camelliae]|nr:hypothetical protein CcaCcLH18_04673 [Colletotrichum camelliae]